MLTNPSIPRPTYVFFCFEALLLLLILLKCPAPSWALVSGGVSIGQEYDSNINRTHVNKEEQWSSVLTPNIVWNSQRPNGSTVLDYGLGLRKNHRTEDQDADHRLVLNTQHQVARHVRFSVLENLVRAEEPVRDEAAGILLSVRRGTNRYLANNCSVGSTVEYARNSSFALTYGNSVMENDTDGQDDFIRHNPAVSLTYEFMPQLQTEFTYGFTRGDFKISDDMDQHNFSLGEEYRLSINHLLFLDYSFGRTLYEISADDYYQKSGSLGWQYAPDQHTTLRTSVGYSHITRDISNSQDGFNYTLGYTRRLESGTFSLNGNGGFEALNFQGNSEGLVRFYSIRVDFNYQLTESLAFSVFSSFRNDSFIEQLPETEETTSEYGAGYNYSFGRWYTLSLSYSYLQLDADNAADDFDDFRFLCSLSARKALWNW